MLLFIFIITFSLNGHSSLKYIRFFARFGNIFPLRKNVEKAHEGMSCLVKLQAYFPRSNTTPWGFFTFLKLYKWYQIVQRITIQDPRHCTVIYYQQFFTMFSIRKSDFLSTSAQSGANFMVYQKYSIMKGHGNGLNDFCTVPRRRLVNQILLKTLKCFTNLF